jgi:branched-chain amino acid transport system substrate-binding protein
MRHAAAATVIGLIQGGTTVRRHLRPGLAGLAAVAAAALAAAGCSSSSSSSSTPVITPSASTASATSVPASTGASTGTGGAGAQSVTNYLSYTGGKSGPASSSLAPVDIGWLNQQGGASAVGPLATAGAETAVKYINAQLGGVDGHPLKLVTCYIANTDAEGTTCGQQFAADKNIDVIATGGVAIGIQPFFTAIGTKTPVIDGVAVTGTDGAQPNAVILFGDATHVLGPFGTYAVDVLHAKTAALVYPDIPGITEGAAAIEAGLKAAGVSVTAVGYDESQTDLTSVLVAAHATTADMVIPYSDSSGCVNLAKSLIQLGITEAKKIVSAPLCLNGQVAAGLGGDFPIWTYAIASSLYGDPTDPGMPTYIAATSKLEPAADSPDPWNIVAFSQILTIDRFMNQIGYANLSPSAILTQAKAFKGPVALGAPSLDCGMFAAAPAVCNDRTQFFLYSGKNHWAKEAGWLQPPS